MKRAGDAARQGRFPEAGGGCGEIHALRRRSRAWPSAPLCQAYLLAADLSRAVRSVASVRIEDQDGTVFAADLDRLAGVGALVEQVAAWLRIVVGNPFPDGLPRRLDGLEGLDVEGRGRWWRDVDDG